MNNIVEIEQHSTSVNLHGLMQVLSKHLYSTPIVALRELVQNAHDAIVRRRIEQREVSFIPEIRVTADSRNKTITICDSGAGLTKQEIHEFLATVGIGYTRQLRQMDDETGLIGMFGLGFLSSFVLAELVTVYTTSWKTPQEGWLYRSDNGETYRIESSSPREPGFTVTLSLKAEFSYLADNALLERLLGRYCILMREPLFVGKSETAVNQFSPPWRRDNISVVSLHPGLKQKQNIEFASRFEHSFTPICTIDVAPYGTSDVVGILWIQDGATYGTSDNRNLSLFLRGMLLDDRAHDLLPLWAGFVGGVVESNILTPTANREDLQRDETYYATQVALAEALIKGLGELAKNQPAVWRRVLRRHNEALLGAAICDERLFDLLKDDLLIPTSRGDIPARNLRQQNSLLVMPGEESSFEEVLFRLTGRPIAFGDRYAVVPFLRRWATLYSAKLIEIGTIGGNQSLFNHYEISEDEETWWREQLVDDEECVISRFEPAVLPFVVVPNREVELKQRLEQDDVDRRMSTAALMLARQFTQRISEQSEKHLYINFNNPTIRALSEFWQKKKRTDEACQLLKSLKIILSIQLQRVGENNFHQALEQLNHLIVTQFLADAGK